MELIHKKLMTCQRMGGYPALGIVVCFLLLCCAANSYAVSTSSHRLESVETLIEQSSAGRLFAEVELKEACERRTRARALLAEARRLVEEEADADEIDRLLDEATREMLVAVRLVKQEASAREAREKEFERLSASLNVLVDAYERIRLEDEDADEENKLSLLVLESREKATALRISGDTPAGLEVLKGAYAAIQTAIGELRGGETLVRSLHFETLADEYAYEVDRNDSLQMLIEVLLGERMAANERLAQQVNAEVEASNSLRADGEALAEVDRFEEAIVTLEASTLKLVHAIRRAGIYIPQ